MADPMQTAVEVLARALCDHERNATLVDRHREAARALLAEIEPLIRTPDPLPAEVLARLAQNFDTYADDCDECTRRGMGSKTKNKHRAECWREAATDVREAAAAIHKSLKEAINGSA